MSALLSLLIINRNRQQGWETEFEGWNPTIEQLPFTSTTAGDFYICHCFFQDTGKGAILINHETTSRVVLERSLFRNLDTSDSARGCVIDASNASCIISNCYAENCINTKDQNSASFAYILNNEWDKVTFQQNSLINSGRVILLPDYPEFDDFSGTGNLISAGSVTIKTFNFTKCSGYRASAICFLGQTSEKATVSMCSFIECFATPYSISTSIPPDQSVTVFYGNRGREFETLQCNFIDCSSKYILYAFSHIVIEGCSFSSSKSQNLVYIDTNQGETDVSLIISQSYIDTSISTKSSFTISDSHTLFTNVIPTFDLNVIFTPDVTPDNTPEITPIFTPNDTPFNTPYESPFDSPLETPFNTPIKTPYSTPFNTPDNTLQEQIPNESSESYSSIIESSAENSIPNHADEGAPELNTDGSSTNNNTIIIIVVCAIVGIIAIVSIIVFVVLKKKHKDDDAEDSDDSNIEMPEETTFITETTQDTITIFTTNHDDFSDPFQDDFEENYISTP